MGAPGKQLKTAPSLRSVPSFGKNSPTQGNHRIGREHKVGFVDFRRHNARRRNTDLL
jgi:hypothetical protein